MSGSTEPAGGEPRISLVAEQDLPDLLPLMRAYCDFYETAPSDEALLGLARSAIADAELEGVQLIARGPRGDALGFASLFWSWDTTEGARVAIMNDLYVTAGARGAGVGRSLIAECARVAAARGAVRVDWQTAPENTPAQALYDRIGGKREPWLYYSLDVSSKPR